MKLIVCLDDQNGMLFHGRRQSRDKVLCENILDTFGNAGLYMNAYSAKLFPANENEIHIGDDLSAKISGYWFVENLDMLPYADRITELVVYRWNRVYPADLYFPIEVVLKRLKLTQSRTFEGNSHPRITEEIYKL